MTAIIILLLALGFLLVLVEALVPGGVIGIIGGILLIAGVALSFNTYGMATGGWIFAGTLIGVMVIVILAFKFLPRSPFGQKMLLSEIVSGGTRDVTLEEERSHLIGHEGIALTDLRPAGRGLVDGKRWDIVTSGGYIDRDAAIRVVRVEGTRIVVESVEQ
jgi:membrane-bound serine protease (ClpP class)